MIMSHDFGIDFRRIAGRHSFGPIEQHMGQIVKHLMCAKQITGKGGENSERLKIAGFF